jgi:hypothetical protein
MTIPFDFWVQRPAEAGAMDADNRKLWQPSDADFDLYVDDGLQGRVVLRRMAGRLGES